MCCSTWKIKPVNPTASNRIFCQCGYCEDCRRAERSQWSFRLQAELLGRMKQGWKAGFFTLTYSDDNLPYWSCSEDISDTWEYSIDSRFACFSRSDVRNFILALRKKLHKDYGIKGISYMVCSEYGSHTQRPHYHGVISWPPVIDSKTMHKLICDIWTKDKGFVFPKDYLGGRDSKGYDHKPFEVDCIVNSAKYCAKYVCKDMGFYADAIEAGIDVKDRYFRKECAPFHIQNRGLGQQFLVDMSDTEKVQLLRHGYAFVGDDKLRSIPIYFRNKLIFDTHYVYDIYTKNRLVRRQANEFFERYKHDIYEKKKEVYTALFDNIKSIDYLANRVGDYFNSVYGPDAFCNSMEFYDIRESFQRNVRLALSFNSSELAEYYLSYFKVPIQYRLFDPCLSWYNHFTQFYQKTDTPKQSEVTDDVISCLLLVYKYLVGPQNPQQELIDYVADFHKHME